MEYKLKLVTKQINPEDLNHEDKIVPGYFTDDLVDDAGHMINRHAMEQAIQEWKQWGNIRDMHGNPVGVAKSVGEKAWNFLEAQIHDDGVWDKIAKKIYKGFSVGILVTDGRFVKVKDVPEEKFAGITSAVRSMIDRMGEVFEITELALVEISVVDRPANPRAVFSVKSLGVESEIGQLPSLTNGGMDVIKSMVSHDINKNEQSVAPQADEQTEKTMEDLKELENEQESNVVEKVEDTEEEAILEEDVSKEADAEDTQEIDEAVEKTVELEDVLKAVSELSNKMDKFLTEFEKVQVPSATDIAAAIKELTSVVEEEINEEETEKDLEPTDDEPESTDEKLYLSNTELSDEFYDKVATKVAEKITLRSGTVNSENDDQDEIEEAVELDKLPPSNLRRVLALSAIARYNR